MSEPRQPWTGAHPPTSSGEVTTPGEAYRCPSCGGEQVRSLDLVHASGTSVGRFATLAGNADAIGIGTTMGNTQSELAARTAPPTPQNVGECWVMGLVGIAIAGFVLAVSDSILVAGCIAALSLIIAGVSARGREEYNDTIWKDAFARWKRTFMCQRCGQTFLPTDLRGSR